MSVLDEILESLNALPEKDKKAAIKLAQDATKDELWLPNPGPQTEAYFSEADEVFYGGAAGGGKSALICGLAVSRHQRSIIFRREYPQIKGLVDEVRSIIGSRDGYNSTDKLWQLPGGNILEFGSVQYEDDKEKYQGRAHDLKAFDEITQFTESQYTYIIGWNRSTDPNQRCRIVVTGNPPLSADGRWVVKRWAPWLDASHPNPAKPGELRWFTTIDGVDVEVSGPDDVPDGSGDRPRSRTFIASRLEDNPDLMDTNYASVLASLPEPMRTMLREGRFDVEAVDDDWQVIPTAWVIAAQKRWSDHPDRNAVMDTIGVDVAQGGNDRTVISRRHGNWFDNLIVKKGVETPDGPSVAAEVTRVIRDQAEIVVDAGGGYGGDTMTQLGQSGMDVKGFNASYASMAKTRDGMHGFVNMRAQAYWQFREALDPDHGDNIALPTDDDLRAELCAPHYEVTPRGIKLEDKKKIKDRTGVSPDKSDAVIFAFASRGPGIKKLKQLRKNASHANLQTQAKTGFASVKSKVRRR